MRIPLKIIAVGIAGAACFGAGTLVGRYQSTKAIDYIHTMQDFERLAIDEDSRHNGVSREAVASIVVPLAVHIEDEVCVGLAARPGVLGGETTYCFDRETKRLTRRLMFGE